MTNDSLEDKCKELASCEIGWWKAHHRQDKPKIIDYMVKEYKILYGISDEESITCIGFRVEAAKEHDLAEKLEDEGNQSESDVHWNKAEELLQKHFSLLYQYMHPEYERNGTRHKAAAHEKLLSYNGGHTRKPYNHS